MIIKIMLVKHLIQRGLYARQLYAFGSPKALSSSTGAPVSKHNPDGVIELTGNHGIEQLSEVEKSISPFHSTEYKRASAYNVFSYFSNSVARHIGRLVEHPKSAIASDSLHLPKIYPNAVPIFDSIDNMRNIMMTQKTLVFVSPLLILAVSPYPTITALFYGLGLYGYYSFIWKFAQDVCIKAELLPQTEEIAYQKINIWGSIVTRKVKISDLEHTTMSQLVGQNDISERGVRGLINTQVVFKIKGSNQLLLFERGGIWHAQGLNHELLI